MRDKSRAIYKLILIATCAAFLTLCSWISFPFIVSFSLQIFAVFLICGCFSPSISLSAILLYILIGLIGVPVFSGFSSGASAIMGASGGFIIAFIFASPIISIPQKRFSKSPAIYIFTMVISLIVCYVCACIWYAFVFCYPSRCSLLAAMSVCVFPFVIFDILKILLASIVRKKLKPFIDKLPL